GAPRHIVENNRQTCRARDRPVMLIKPFLRGLVVIRRNRKQTVCAHRFEFARQLHHFRGVVPARARHHCHSSLPFFERTFHAPPAPSLPRCCPPPPPPALALVPWLLRT